MNQVTTISSLFNTVGVMTAPYDNSVKRIIEEYSLKNNLELQVLDSKGNILLSSSGFIPPNKIQTQDYQAALEGKNSLSIGPNDQTQQKVIAVSSPLKNGEVVIGAFRVVSSLEETDGVILKTIFISLLVLVVFILLILFFSLFFSKSIIDPINEINTAAKKMAGGQFKSKILKKYDDELGELSDTLNFMADEILNVQNLKNDFISSVSHELRTPLTSIRGWGETILTGDFEDQDQTRKGLKIIIRETERLTQMVEELLDFSKIESGRMTLSLEKLDINTEIEEIIQIFKGRVKKETLDIEYYGVQETLITMGDKNRLRQVFINLLDNAVKFSQPGKKITIEAFNEEKNIIIKIQDEGIGIAQDEILKVKEKFYKGKSQKTGSGIGLGISDEIIRLHKGSLNIESKLGIGTLITIKLPIC